MSKNETALYVVVENAYRVPKNTTSGKIRKIPYADGTAEKRQSFKFFLF